MTNERLEILQRRTYGITHDEVRECAKELLELRETVTRLKGERDALRETLSGRGREDESSDSERHGISNPDNDGSIPSARSKLQHYREAAKTRENLSIGSPEEMIAEDLKVFEAFRPLRERANAGISETEQLHAALSQAQQALRRQAEKVCMFWVRDKSVTDGNYGKMEFKEEDVQRTMKKWLAEAALPSDAPPKEEKGEKSMDYENDPNVTHAHEKAQEFIRKHPNVPVVDVPEVSEPPSDAPEAAKLCPCGCGQPSYESATTVHAHTADYCYCEHCAPQEK